MQWDESSLSNSDVMLDLPAKHTEVEETRGKASVREGVVGLGNGGSGNGNGVNKNDKNYRSVGKDDGKVREGKNVVFFATATPEVATGMVVGTETGFGIGASYNTDNHTDYTNLTENKEDRHQNNLPDEKATVEIPTPRCLVIAVSTYIIDIMNTYRIKNKKRRTSVTSDTDNEEIKSSKSLSPESSTFFRKILGEEDSNISILTLKKLSKLSNLPKIRENLDFLSASLPILNVKSNSPNPNDSHGSVSDEEEDEI
jgi:hypothetical protein